LLVLATELYFAYIISTTIHDIRKGDPDLYCRLGWSELRRLQKIHDPRKERKE